MTRRTKTITLAASIATSLAGVAAAAMLVSSCDSGTSRGEIVARTLDASKLSLTDAIALVQETRSGGVVIEVELEIGDDEEDEKTQRAAPRFEVEQFVDGAVLETAIDTVSGQIVDAHIDPEDLATGKVVAAALSNAGIDIADAVRRAEQHVQGRAFGVEIDVREGVYEVAVVAGTQLWEVEISLADGTVLEAEPEDDEDEDDEDDDDDDDDEN